MGKLRCICENILSDVCGNDAEVFTEDQTESIGFNENDCYLAGNGRSILECPECGTLAIEDPIQTNSVKFYIPENGKFNELFRK